MQDPIAYAADADTYCEACTLALYGTLEGDDHEGDPIGAIAPWDEVDPASGLYCGYCGGMIVESLPWTVVENTPGYLPDDDDPAAFHDWRDAIRYMVARMRDYRDYMTACGADIVGWLDREAGEGYLRDEGRPHDLGRYFAVVETPPL